MLTHAGVLALLAGSALAYQNGVAQRPAMGWNTWCTEASCDQPAGAVPPHEGSMHDVCNHHEMMEVAHAMLKNGMYELGFTSVHADDCWAATGRNAAGELYADPDRFPTGWAGLAKDLRALGFTNGLYTSAGNKTCSSGQRNGTVPGSFGHFEQDARTFAEMTVDYVKIDFCGDHAPTARGQHTEFSHALNATGRPIWLELCRGYSYPPPPYTQQVAQSARVSGDHHDHWINTLGIMLSLSSAATTDLSGPSGGFWGYGDFLMTGGAGCDVNATTHCPGMTDTEYTTEFAVWTITSSPLIVATDVRNMTSIMRKLLLNPEAIAINQDQTTPVGHIVGTYPCPAIPLACQLWARNLTDGTVAVALVNADTAEHTIELDFSLLGGDFAGKTLSVRDVIERKDMGKATGAVSAKVPPHGTAYYRLSASQVPPLDVPRQPLTAAAKRLLGRE